MSSGVVKWFNSLVGYGFITGFDGAEIYFHRTAIREVQQAEGFATGTRVEFDLIQTKIGFEAANVRRTGV